MGPPCSVTLISLQYPCEVHHFNAAILNNIPNALWIICSNVSVKGVARGGGPPRNPEVAKST